VWLRVSELTAEEQAAAAAVGAAAGDEDEDDEGGAPAPEAAPAAAPAPPAGKKGAAKGKGGKDEAAAAAPGGAAGAPAPAAAISIHGRAVPATVNAVAAHFQAWVAGKPGAPGGPAGADADGAAGAGARAAAAAALSAAVAANFAYVRDAVKQPVLPDVPALRRAGAADAAGLGVVIGEESSVVAGARVTVTITRAPGAWPALKALEAAATAAGAAPGAAAQAAARTAAVAVVCAAPGAGLLQAGAQLTRYDGVALSLVEGAHVFSTPEALLGCAASDGEGLRASAADAFPGSTLLAAAAVSSATGAVRGS